MANTITIKKEKEGTWHPKTVYWAYVDDYLVGKYQTQKDAKRAAEAHIEQEKVLFDSLAAEFED